MLSLAIDINCHYWDPFRFTTALVYTHAALRGYQA